MESIHKNDNIIIFGAGGLGKIAYESLHENYNIIGFSDNDKRKWGNLYINKPVIEPKRLLQFSEQTIIIASEYYAVINRQLRDMGLNNIRVFIYKEDIKSEIDRNAYELYEIPKEYLFELCSIDWEKINRIKDNFSENYNASKNIDEIVIKRNKNLKKVLFCAYTFPPTAGGGVQRSLKFVKYLRRYGYEPIVLTVSPEDNYYQIKDESLFM